MSDCSDCFGELEDGEGDWGDTDEQKKALEAVTEIPAGDHGNHMRRVVGLPLKPETQEKK